MIVQKVLILAVCMLLALGTSTSIAVGESKHVVKPGLDGTFCLTPSSGHAVGCKVKRVSLQKALGSFTNKCYVTYAIDVAKVGTYEVWINWATPPRGLDCPFVIEAATSRLAGVTSGDGVRSKWKCERFGILQLQAGRQSILMRCGGSERRMRFDLGEIRLVPTEPVALPEDVRLETIKTSADGSIRLGAINGRLVGSKIKYMPKRKALGWFTTDAQVLWAVDVAKSGTYEVWLDWALPNELADNPFRISVGTNHLTGAIPSSGSWSQWAKGCFGTIEVNAGTQFVVIQSDGRIKNELCDLREIQLIPIKAAK